MVCCLFVFNINILFTINSLHRKTLLALKRKPQDALIRRFGNMTCGFMTFLLMRFILVADCR
ncbi:MAG TPA: hypothetical protein DCR60_02725 [Psychrobacter sp.]|nr:hypothetical protein [Psychrobacter sp.]